MIPQSELDRALARWKARKAGAPEPVTPSPAMMDDAVPQETIAEMSSGVIAIADVEVAAYRRAEIVPGSDVGHFLQQFLAHRAGEILEVDGDLDEGARAAGDAVEIVLVEVGLAREAERVGPVVHDRQPVDHDALLQRGVPEGGDQAAVVVRTVARDVEHLALGFIRTAAEQRDGIADGAADRGGARNRDRRGGEAACEVGDRGLGIEQGPVDQELLHPGVGPFVVGDGDPAVAAAQDRLDDHRIAEGVDIALALQAGLVGVDAARDVDGHRQCHVDFFPVLGGYGGWHGEEQERKQTQKSGHGDLRGRMLTSDSHDKHKPYRPSEAPVSRALDGRRRRPLASVDRPAGERPWI